MTTQQSGRRHIRLATPLGELLVAAQGEAVVGCYFDAQKHFPGSDWFGPEVPTDDDETLAEAALELSEYFAGERTQFDLPVQPEGTEFQRKIWELLRAIPYGETTTYGALSAELSPDGVATPGLAQGVGQAVGHNPISVIIPCHRVVGADGSLTGFAGGLARKRWLLTHEEPETVRETRLF